MNAARFMWPAGFAVARLFEAVAALSAAQPASGLPPAPPLQGAAVLSGTPRYLMFRSLYGANTKAPPPVPGCQLAFQARAGVPR